MNAAGYAMIIATMITTLGGVVVAVINARVAARRIGPENGHGNVQEHLSEIRQSVKTIEAKLCAHVADDSSHWRPPDAG